ncbi:hypothetical protein Tco_0738455, partial [Tanacetum coccineum]
MGTIPEIFPQNVLTGYNPYKVLFIQEHIPLFEYTLQFSATFKLPWILPFTHKKKESEGSSPPLLIRQWSAKWWKVIKESQADREAVDKYHNSLIARTTKVSSGSSTSGLSMTNKEIAQRIKDCSNNEELLEIFINEIRGSLTPSENLFQDSQDPYEDENFLNMKKNRKFEKEADAGGMMEIVVDPLVTSGISESTRGDVPDLEDTLYDIVHYMLE